MFLSNLLFLNTSKVKMEDFSSLIFKFIPRQEPTLFGDNSETVKIKINSLLHLTKKEKDQPPVHKDFREHFYQKQMKIKNRKALPLRL